MSEETASEKPDAAPGAESPATGSTGSYVVLARKYRPGDFSGLIGQATMVRTLTNAF